MKKRLQIFFSFFLLMSFSWQGVAYSVIYINFKFNQKELAATVCENKNKPKSCCEAKCYLQKEIKKEDRRQSNSSSPIKDKTEKSELRAGLIMFVFLPVINDKQNNTFYLTSISNSFFTTVFRPPNF